MKLRFLFPLITLLIIFSSCEKDPDIDDNAELPIVSISGASGDEGDTGTSVLTFTVRLNKTSSQDVFVNYTTNNVTAAEGQDYEGANGNITIPAGSTEVELNINIFSDENLEQDESFEVVISNPINAFLSASSSIAVGTILNDDTSNPISDVGYTTPLTYPGMTLVWQDEFEGTALNTDDWTYETGNNGWGNNELQNYLNGTNNAVVADGRLTIEAKKVGSTFTSARLKTQGKQSFQYGRVDIRATLPHGQGIWPALWMLGESFSTVGWPACGEIDIMELVGHEANKVHGTVHWEHQGNHADFGGSKTLSSGIFADEFHVFSVIWDSQKITWLMDDQQYHVIDITGGELSEFHDEFFFIFNVAVGGNWPGNPDASTIFPQKMVVDYVRVFQ